MRAAAFFRGPPLLRRPPLLRGLRCCGCNVCRSLRLACFGGDAGHGHGQEAAASATPQLRGQGAAAAERSGEEGCAPT